MSRSSKGLRNLEKVLHGALTNPEGEIQCGLRAFFVAARTGKARTMANSRKDHFASATRGADGAGVPTSSDAAGIWELPDHVVDSVSGALDFYETVGGGIDFAQGFSCFAQRIGDFSQGDPNPILLPQ